LMLSLELIGKNRGMLKHNNNKIYEFLTTM
jgi:hypothetical protein